MASQPGITRDKLQRELAKFEADYSAAPTGGAVKWQLLGDVRRMYDGIINQVSPPHLLQHRAWFWTAAAKLSHHLLPVAPGVLAAA